MPLFKRFERLLHAYPEAEPTLPPQGFMAFIWACSRGTRRYILALALLSAAMAAFEALMFAMLGRIVEEGDHRTLLGNGGLYARLWAHQSGGFLPDQFEE